jgi:spermidine/putrescine-binding protein
MKKFVSILAAASVAATVVCGLSGCGSEKASEDKPYAGTTLNLYTWTEYIPDSVIKDFEKETGITVKHSTFSSNEDMLAKIKSEDEGAFDIIQPSDYMVEQMASQGMLEEIDKSRLTNLSNIDEKYLDPSYDPDNTYSIPYLGGVEAMAVNTSKVSGNITKYDDLFDPSFANQVVLLDDFRAVIGLTARSLGYSMSTSDPSELDEIKTKLLTLKSNVKLYDSDSPKSALIQGEASIGAMWAAEVALAMDENPDIDVVFPEEGAYLFMDNWAIPKGAKNYNAAMEFINYMLDSENMAKILEEFPYMCPNSAAVALMGDEYASNLAKNPPSEVIENGEYIKNLDLDTLAVYDQMWTELKK